MTSANGVPYSWDANRILANNGVNAYTDDHANRLVSLTQGAQAYTFGYNGLGDRLQQSVGEETTTYSLDLNAGLTQVLADGTNTYLYGLSRVAQYSETEVLGLPDPITGWPQVELLESWLYYLPDALGSVRQLADADGAVTLAQSFEPYGESLGAFGPQATSYGFAGEWTDSTGLVHLRARYYAPTIARFVSKDTWDGNFLEPLSLNAWNYVSGNPVLLTDPSGQCPQPARGTGNVICLDLFISSAKIMNGQGDGDGRSFQTNSLPSKSRAYIYVYLDENNRVINTEDHVNRSCTNFGCFGPYPQFNHFDVDQEGDGDIKINWHLINGFSGALRADIAEILKSTPSITGPILGLLATCSSYVIIPAIDGRLTLSFGDKNRWTLTELDRDPYPSMEIYYYKDGRWIYTISTRTEWPSGNPIIGLHPYTRLFFGDRVP